MLPVACHMLADTEDQLEDMARTLGLKRRWRHGDHYDLAPARRRQAVKLGAVELSSRQMVKVRKAGVPFFGK